MLQKKSSMISRGDRDALGPSRTVTDRDECDDIELLYQKSNVNTARYKLTVYCI